LLESRNFKNRRKIHTTKKYRLKAFPGFNNIKQSASEEMYYINTKWLKLRENIERQLKD
jgi:hypothetical protein